MEDRFIFNAIVTSYYDIDTPDEYKEFEPQIYLENVDVFSDGIGIDYDRLLDAIQTQLKLEKPEASQVMQFFEDNSNANSEEYVTIKPEKILQCTGLKDKNGKLIFEGDIVKGTSYFDNNSEMLFTIIWEENYCQFLAENNGFVLVDLMGANNIEVIGNIYENPELIKEGE